MLLIALCLPALAVDIDTFAPSGAPLSGGSGLQVVDARVVAPDTWTAGLVLGWADAPLVSAFEDGSELVVVAGQGATRLGGSWAFDARGTPVRVDADVPFYPWIGFAYENGGVPGYAMGDARVSATVPVWRQGGLTAAVVPALSLPTGSTKAWTGAGAMGAGVGGAVAWEPTRVPRLVVTGNLGVEAVPSGRLNDVDFGSGVRLAAGAAWSPLAAKPAWRVGAELDGRYTVVPGDGGGARHPTEAHVFTSWAGESGPQITAGVGAGLVAGLGTPDVRGVLAFGWRGKVGKRGGMEDPAKSDSVATDPLERAARACDAVKRGVFEQLPLEIDKDADGVPNQCDAAPDAPEDRDGVLDDDGIPEQDESTPPASRPPSSAVPSAPAMPPPPAPAGATPTGPAPAAAPAKPPGATPTTPPSAPAGATPTGPAPAAAPAAAPAKPPGATPTTPPSVPAGATPTGPAPAAAPAKAPGATPTTPPPTPAGATPTGPAPAAAPAKPPGATPTTPPPVPAGAASAGTALSTPPAGPAKSPAVAVGSPVDPDGDGFLQGDDACPDKAPRTDEVVALSRGCPGGDVWAREALGSTGEKLVVLVLPAPLAFRADDALEPSSDATVLAVARWLAANPRAAAVEIAVHTDNAELPEAERLARTQLRADVLRAKLLASSGLKGERIVAKGYGQAQPLDTNKVELGRARNRRVEIRITRIDPPKPPSP